MKNKIAVSYETKLELAEGQNITAILDAKLEATSSQGTVDYIGFAVDNLDSKIERMKQAKKELDFLIKMADKQKDIIKLGSALWLVECGLDKLDGDIISSISVTTPAAKETVNITNEESIINQGYFKTVIDKTAVKDALLEGAEIEGAEIEVEHQSSTLRINKKRAKKA